VACEDGECLRVGLVVAEGTQLDREVARAQARHPDLVLSAVDAEEEAREQSATLAPQARGKASRVWCLRGRLRRAWWLGRGERASGLLVHLSVLADRDDRIDTRTS
jgi:hypothetical protein